MLKPVFSFACKVVGCPEWGESLYNTTSAGKAKSQHHRAVSEVWADVLFTQVRVRKIGPVHTSDDFRRNALYRGMPEVSCGQRVQVRNALGTIVGHNGSANFEVMFDEDGPHRGLTLNVHPAEVCLLGAFSVC